ncbi:MAG: SDR family oxidoreductase [bacterium]|nr:SDR family oxidoreductase [bacterium]
MQLNNKVALITGAGAGIGRSIAIKLASEGVKIIVNDYNLDNAKETVDIIIKDGGSAIPFQADISNRKHVFAMVEKGTEKFGSIDILINNAGVGASFLIEDMPPEVWDKNIAVNLTGTFNCTKAVVPDMIKNKYGKIIFIGSVAAHRTGGRGKADYVTSKHGILGFMKEMAYELGRYNIASNMVCPGATLTDMLRSVQSNEEIEALKKGVPIGDIALPNDIAESVAFLVSDSAIQITGQSLNVDSGSMLSMGTGYSEQIKWHSELSKKKLNEWNNKEKYNI